MASFKKAFSPDLVEEVFYRDVVIRATRDRFGEETRPATGAAEAAHRRAARRKALLAVLQIAPPLPPV